MRQRWLVFGGAPLVATAAPGAKNWCVETPGGVRGPILSRFSVSSVSTRPPPRYAQTARSVLFNLRADGSGSLKSRLLSGALAPERLPNLTAEEMASAETRAKRARFRRECMEEVQTDWALKRGQANVTGMFTCGKCGSSKTTYYQLQTRKSGEPMTTFVSCLVCGKRFRC